MDVVRVLLRMDAAGAEPDLALGLVDAVHAANDPGALGDLVLDLPGLGVVKIKVVPAVAFRHPDQFPAAIEIVQEVLARIIDERGALLIDDRLDRAAGGIDGQEPQRLVSALIVDEGEAAGIGGPAVVLHAPGIVEEAVLDGHRFPPGEIEHLRPLDRQRIAGLGVGVRVQFRLHLIAGRRLDEIDRPLRDLLGADGDQLLGIGRPVEPAAVGVFRSAVMAQGEFLAASRADPDVIVLDIGLPAAVGGLGLRPPAGLAARVRAAVHGRVGVAGIITGVVKRAWFGLVGLLLRRADFHCRVVVPGDFQPQRRSLVIDDQPDVSGIGVLLVFLAGANPSVALSLAFGVEPEEFDLAGRAVDKRDGRILAGSPAGPRAAFIGLQGLPRRVGGRSAGPRGKLVAFQIAAPPAAADLEVDKFAGRIEGELVDGQAIGRGGADLLLGQGRGQFLVIEGRPAAALFRLDEDKLLGCRSGADLVPEPAVVIEPVRFERGRGRPCPASGSAVPPRGRSRPSCLEQRWRKR